MTEGEWVFAVSACIICYFFCTPFTLYSFVRFRRLSEKDAYQKRLPSIVKYSVILCTFSFLLEKPLAFIAFTSPMRVLILQRASVIFYCLFSRSYFYLMLVRYWLLFYSLHLDKYQANAKWKKHLNPRNDAQDFWFLHRNTFGSERHCFRFFFVCYLIDTILISAFYWIFLDDASHLLMIHFIDIILYIIAALFMLFIAYKVPRYIDNYFIAKELRIVCCVFISAAVFYFFAICISNIFFLLPYLSLSFSFILQQICTLWVAKTEEQRREKQHELQPVQSLTQSTRSTSDDINSSANESTPHSKLISLPMILSNTESFELFALYLIEEYSLEIILCFVELLEFKKAFRMKYLLYLNDDASFYGNEFDVEYMNEYIDVNMSGCSSFIVDSNLNRINDEAHDVQQFINVFHNIIYLLYHKYIETNGKFAVTLSIEYMLELEQYVNRQIVQNKYDADEKDDIENTAYLKNIYQYFDDMLSELYLCMDPPYQRFVRSQRFRDIVSNIFNQKVKQKGCCNKTMFISV